MEQQMQPFTPTQVTAFIPGGQRHEVQIQHSTKPNR